MQRRDTDAADKAGRTEPAPASRGGGLRQIGRTLDRVVPLPLRRQAALVARLKLDWPLIVGEALAASTMPERLAAARDNRLPVLHLRVSGAAATMVQHAEPQILSRIAVHFGHPVAERIRIRQGTVVAVARRRLAPPPAPSPAARQRIEASVAGIADPALAAALADLGSAVSGTDPRRGR